MTEELKYKLGDIVYIEGQNNTFEKKIKGVYKIIYLRNTINPRFPYSVTRNLKHKLLSKTDKRFSFLEENEIKFLYKNKSQLFAYKV